MKVRAAFGYETNGRFIAAVLAARMSQSGRGLNWESSIGYLGIQRRLIGNAKPAIWVSGGPARTRTEDQGIHSIPPFPEGVDYLFTPEGCGTL